MSFRSYWITNGLDAMRIPVDIVFIRKNMVARQVRAGWL